MDAGRDAMKAAKAAGPPRFRLLTWQLLLFVAVAALAVHAALDDRAFPALAAAFAAGLWLSSWWNDQLLKLWEWNCKQAHQCTTDALAACHVAQRAALDALELVRQYREMR